MRYLYCILLVFLSLISNAQEDIFEKSNKRVRGFVRTLKTRSDMVRMVSDTLVYGEFKGIHTYTFDDDSRILTDTAITRLNEDTMCYRYIYNDDRRLMGMQGQQTTLLDKYSINIHTNIDYKYADDKLVEICERIEKGKCLWITRYQYHNDTVHVAVLYDFDEYDKPTQNDYNYFYDEKGEHITMIQTYKYGQVVSTQSFEYDVFGNPIRQKVYDSTGKVEYDYTYEYIYDAHHNFTQRFTYRFKQPFTITTRVITYQ